MQNDGKIQRRLIFLIILNIIVLVSVVVLSNLTYAQEDQELHQKTLYEITKYIPSKQNAHITVGQKPTGIGINFLTDRIYVANSGDNTVSVIDDKNNTKIGNDIPVGKEPSGIGPDSLSGIYVTNRGDNTVSVIDPEANKVVAKVMFNIEPFNAGHIECDKLITPIEQQFYLYSGSECIAKPNQGFEFVSWQENLGGNSTQFIKLSSTPYWILF